MAHLITPIILDGNPYCCQPATRRTVAILTDAATELGPNQWEIYRAYQDNTPKQGSVKFGICCATNIEITLNGQIETLNAGYDWISVLHNGAEVFSVKALTPAKIRTIPLPWGRLSSHCHWRKDHAVTSSRSPGPRATASPTMMCFGMPPWSSVDRLSWA